MEFKKKTIIWEDNNEPPKDYLWVKSDGKVYEYSYVSKKWVESKYLSTCGSSSGSSCNCPGVMIVEGTINRDNNDLFIPNSGSPSFQDTKSFINQGGIVYLKSPDMIGVPVYVNFNGHEVIMIPDFVNWPAPVIVYGTVSESLNHETHFFIEDEGQMHSSDAKEGLAGGYQIALSYEVSGETIVDNIIGYNSDFHALYTERDVLWYDDSLLPPVG